MESMQERQLAYTLATVISEEEMDHVSGGVGGDSLHQQTVQITGSSARGMDMQYDYRW